MSSNIGRNNRVPTFYEKTLLVLFKKYPSRDKIPNEVPELLLRVTRDKGRIAVSILTGVVAAIGLGTAAFIGKSQANKGISLRKMNEDFIKNTPKKINTNE